MIYMHRIQTDPVLEPIQDHLREFAAIPRISDGHLPLRLHIIMSYDKTSGNITESEITSHESRLRVQMDSLNTSRWQPSIHHEFFDGEPGVAWRAVQELFREFKQDSSHLNSIVPHQVFSSSSGVL
jgi:hypothetical protein